jgi:hypothetical protein
VDLNVYISLLGRSVWASLNTYYAVLDETDHRPEIIWVVTESSFEDQLPALIEGYDVISTSFNIKPIIKTVILPEGNISEAGIEVRGLVDSYTKEDVVALDITSARKALVAGALLATADNKPAHIFYLKIDSLDDSAKPYLMIPRQIQTLHDFRAETRSPPR